MKKLLFLLLLVSSSVFAQKVEHGVLGGAGIGFAMNDKFPFTMERHDAYQNDPTANLNFGYRFRFLPAQKLFFDLDMKVVLQWFQYYVDNISLPEDWENAKPGELVVPAGKSHTDFLVPLSVAASCNYHITDRFHIGLGVSPTLYVNPGTTFDLPVLAKIGYRLGRHCELGLSYQYGCLNVLKHLNRKDGYGFGRYGHMSDLMVSVYIPLFSK